MTQSQNKIYFFNKNNVTTQNDGLAMGAPSSGILSEIFLQHIENLHITHLTQKHEIIKYFRHVDDMLLIFDSNHTNIQDILTDLNTIHPNVHFTAETEHNNKIKYLDISIHKTAHNISLANYRHYHPLLFQPHHTR